MAKIYISEMHYCLDKMNKQNKINWERLEISFGFGDLQNLTHYMIRDDVHQDKII